MGRVFLIVEVHCKKIGTEELGYGCVGGMKMTDSNEKLKIRDLEEGKTRAIASLAVIAGPTQEEETGVEEVFDCAFIHIPSA